MAAWLTYVKERFPPPVYALLICGFVFSGMCLAGHGFMVLPFLVSLVGFLLFFFQLRLMDELKDYDKDVVAHPDRPLPRGLLSPGQVRTTIIALNVAMVVFAMITALLTNCAAAGIYIFITGYLYLMYREFFAGTWLQNRPMLYAFSHQVIVFAVCAFSMAVFDAGAAFHGSSFFFGLTVMGAFLCYEICRKLDPEAHPALQTYLSVYGAGKTALWVCFMALLAGVGAAGLGLGVLLWPVEGLVVASLLVILFKPEKFKVVEAVASLSLLVHLWAVVIQTVTGWPK